MVAPTTAALTLPPMDQEHESPFLSIVIPVKNEEATISALATEIDRALAAVAYRWEVLWVDDGSTDRTLSLLRALPAPHRWLTFDRNHGQSAAFAAGFRHARGQLDRHPGWRWPE